MIFKYRILVRRRGKYRMSEARKYVYCNWFNEYGNPLQTYIDRGYFKNDKLTAMGRRVYRGAYRRYDHVSPYMKFMRKIGVYQEFTGMMGVSVGSIFIIPCLNIEKWVIGGDENYNQKVVLTLAWLLWSKNITIAKYKI